MCGGEEIDPEGGDEGMCGGNDWGRSVVTVQCVAMGRNRSERDDGGKVWRG